MAATKTSFSTLSLFLLLLTIQTSTQSVRSLAMTKMIGWKFQCANSTCIPFSTSTAPTVFQCHVTCLSQARCRALTFLIASSTCQLFISTPNLTQSMLPDANTISMITKGGTRTPSTLLSIVGVNGTIQAILNTTAGANSVAATIGVGLSSVSEGPNQIYDNDLSTKYLNFGQCGSMILSTTCGTDTGFFVELQRGSSLVTGLQLCTGADWADRDPISVTLEGSDLSGTALTQGSSWTLIYSGSSGLESDPGRSACGNLKSLSNTKYFTSYRFIVSSKRGYGDSVQYSELQLYGY